MENIQTKFSLTLPANFNWPHHSVSTVTKSTVMMAIYSFDVIQDNLKLMRKVQNKSNNSEGGELCDGEVNKAFEDRVLAQTASKYGEVISEEFRGLMDDQEEQIEFLKKVDPISTTTEAVEHFHSLAHRKTQVQTVREYITSFAVIVA